VNEQGRIEPLSWQALSAVLLAMLAITVGYGIVLPILPFLIERLASTSDAATLSRHTGLLTGTYILAIFLFAPLWGRVSDWRGRRVVMLLGLTGFAATVALFALVERLPLLYLGRFLDGVFAAAIAPAAYALIGDHAPSKEWRARRFAMINLASTVGFFVGPLIGGLVLRGTTLLTDAPERALSSPFFATAALSAMAALAIWRLASDAQRPQPHLIIKGQMVFERSATRRLWIIAFVTAVAVGAFEVGLSLRGKQVLGMDAYQIGMMFTECSLVMFLVQALVFSPLIRPEITRWFIAPRLALLAIGLVLVPLASGYIAMTTTAALIAASAGILSPIVTYWVSLGGGDTQGADLGNVTAAASLGQAVGSAAGGLLFNVALLPNAGFTVAALIVAAGFAVSFGLPPLLCGAAEGPPQPSTWVDAPSPAQDLTAEAAIRASRHPHEHG
jgi:MFS family permease